MGVIATCGVGVDRACAGRGIGRVGGVGGVGGVGSGIIGSYPHPDPGLLSEQPSTAGGSCQVA